MFICVVDFAAGVPIISFLIIKSFKSLRAQQHIMSTKTYKMHRQLLISLIFQLLVPLISLFGPFMIASSFIFLELPIPGSKYFMFIIEFISSFSVFNQLTIILGTLHSPMNCIMMLYFIPYYRKAMLQYASCFRIKFRGRWAGTWSQHQTTQHNNNSVTDTRNGNKVNPTLSATAGDMGGSSRGSQLF